jgi:hypothetical protein
MGPAYQGDTASLPTSLAGMQLSSRALVAYVQDSEFNSSTEKQVSHNPDLTSWQQKLGCAQTVPRLWLSAKLMSEGQYPCEHNTLVKDRGMQAGLHWRLLLGWSRSFPQVTSQCPEPTGRNCSNSDLSLMDGCIKTAPLLKGVGSSQGLWVPLLRDGALHLTHPTSSLLQGLKSFS